MSHTFAANSGAAGAVSLTVHRVVGTSASSPACFVCVGNHVAYTSGAGVVVHVLSDPRDSSEKDDSSLTTDSADSYEYTSSRSSTSMSSGCDSAVRIDDRFFCTVSPDFSVSKAGAGVASSLGSSGTAPKRDMFGFLIGVPAKVLRSSFDNSIGSGLSTSNGINHSFGKNANSSFNSIKNGGISSNINSGLSPGSPYTSDDGGRKDRAISPSCVALSPNLQLVAVGESGYQPQVVLYSLAPDATTQGPLVMLSAHDIGINHLAFSPCGRFLASLGVAANGFLHIWSLGMMREAGTVQLLASNRCISDVVAMKWAGTRLYTIGKRHIRSWRLKNYSYNSAAGAKSNGIKSTIGDNRQENIEDDGVLAGRNLILGEFSNCNFVALETVRPDLLVVATDQGDLATIHDSFSNGNDGQKIEFVPRLCVGFAITAMSFDFWDGILWVFGPTPGHLRAIDLEILLKAGPLRSPSMLSSKITLASNYITALYITNHRCLTTLNADRRMRQFQLPANKPREELIEIINSTSGLTSYEGAYPPRDWISNPQLETTPRELKNSVEGGVKGVRALPTAEGGFLTWSSSGLVQIWSFSANDGTATECMAQLHVPLDDLENDIVQNQLSIVEPLSRSTSTDKEVHSDERRLTLVTGDRFGMVRVITTVGATTKMMQSFYAHGAEVVDIACAPPMDPKSDLAQQPRMFVTTSRDKTVQIFVKHNFGLEENSNNEWELLQTLVTHKTSVVRVLVADAAGERIVSCANDRTAVIHRAIYEGSEIVAYIPEKVISLKSAPIDMVLDHSNTNSGSKTNLIVSCNDKIVYIYRFPSGELVHFYKVGDRRTGSLALRDISILRVPKSLIAPEKPDNGKNKKKQTNRQKYLVATGADKSVRVYRHQDGSTPAACQWAHCEGVSGLQVVSGAPKLVSNSTAATWILASCGHDGCLVFWKLKISFPETGKDDAADKRIAMRRSMPTRKVLSKTDLERLARTSSSNVSGNPTTLGAGSPTRTLTVPKARSLRHSMSALSLETSSSSFTMSSLSQAPVPSRQKQAPSANANGEKTVRRTLSTSEKLSYPLAINKRHSLPPSQPSAVLLKPKQEEDSPVVVAKTSQSVKPVLRQVSGSNSSDKGNKKIATTKLGYTAEVLASELAQFRRQYHRCVEDATEQQHQSSREVMLPPVTPAALESLRKELQQTLTLLDKQALLSL